MEGQYADIYAKIYRQQSDSRTKTELDRPMFLDIDLDRRTVLEKISSIKPKIYCYTEDKTQTPILGFFAQDLEREFPLTVNTMKYTEDEINDSTFAFPKDKNGNDIHDLKTIDPVAVSAVLWQGLQEAQNTILDLKDDINVLKKEIETIKNKAVK